MIVFSPHRLTFGWYETRIVPEFLSLPTMQILFRKLFSLYIICTTVLNVAQFMMEFTHFAHVVSLQFILAFFGYIAVAVVVDWMFVVPVAILIGVFYLTRVVYLKSAKNIKRLEGMSE